METYTITLTEEEIELLLIACKQRKERVERNAAKCAEREDYTPEKRETRSAEIRAIAAKMGDIANKLDAVLMK